MPNSALLFVPLLAGFIFLRILHWTRYISRSWENTRLVFNAGVVGLSLVSAVRLLLRAVRFMPWGSDFLLGVESDVQGIFPEPYSGTLACTVILALVVPLLVNQWITKEKAVQKTKNSGNRLHAMLVEQAGTSRAVALTLTDGKVYIGLVKQPPTLNPSEKYVLISPDLSGFRDEQMRLRITTNYFAAKEILKAKGEGFEGWDEDHLSVAVALDQIVSAHLFNPRLYTDVFLSEIPEEDSDSRNSAGARPSPPRSFLSSLLKFLDLLFRDR